MKDLLSVILTLISQGFALCGFTYSNYVVSLIETISISFGLVMDDSF